MNIAITPAKVLFLIGAICFGLTAVGLVSLVALGLTFCAAAWFIG